MSHFKKYWPNVVNEIENLLEVKVSVFKYSYTITSLFYHSSRNVMTTCTAITQVERQLLPLWQGKMLDWRDCYDET
jgi:hypothetical protein